MTIGRGQWSLRNLLIATAIIPVAVYMLAKANAMLVSAVITVAIAVWIAMAIVAFVGKGERRAFASGALIAATVYGAVVYFLGDLSLVGSSLFTTGLLYYAHEACVTRTMVPVQGGMGMGGGGSMMMMSGMGGGMPAMMLANESPNGQHFVMIGQAYWGILIGIIGGWFACWVARREQNEAAARPNSNAGA